MPVSKYEAYLRIGKALKNSDRVSASKFAQTIINSERHLRRIGEVSNNLSLSREEKQLFKEGY